MDQKGHLTAEEEVEWRELLEAARLSFDDAKAEAQAKREAAAAKKLKRAGLEEPPVDLAKVRRALLAYSRTRRYAESVDGAGIPRADMVTAFDLWPDAKAVCEYVGMQRDEQRRLEMADLVGELHDSLRELVRDRTGRCGVNAKAVMFGLERLDRANFGEQTDGRAQGARDGVTYNLPGLTINMITAPAALLEGRRAADVPLEA